MAPTETTTETNPYNDDDVYVVLLLDNKEKEVGKKESKPLIQYWNELDVVLKDVLLTERRQGRLIKVYTHTHTHTSERSEREITSWKLPRRQSQ